MRSLVVNADDLGLHPAIDEGIFVASREGIVTSASVLVTGRCAAEAVRRAREAGLALGVHLCLTTSLPAAAERVPTLLTGGRFRRSWRDVALALCRGAVEPGEVAVEFRAQVQRLRALGAEPDHLDGHQHVHLMPGIAAIVAAIGREERLPVRWPSERPVCRSATAWLAAPARAAKSGVLSLLSASRRCNLRAAGAFDAGRQDEARLLRWIDLLPPGDHELACHPGGAPGEIPEEPGWAYRWETERDALCSPRVRERLRLRNVSLTTWGARS